MNNLANTPRYREAMEAAVKSMAEAVDRAILGRVKTFLEMRKKNGSQRISYTIDIPGTVEERPDFDYNLIRPEGEPIEIVERASRDSSHDEA